MNFKGYRKSFKNKLCKIKVNAGMEFLFCTNESWPDFSKAVDNVKPPTAINRYFALEIAHYLTVINLDMSPYQAH